MGLPPPPPVPGAEEDEVDDIMINMTDLSSTLLH